MSLRFWGYGIPLFGGSEDSKIHCCKNGETCKTGTEKLSVLDDPSLAFHTPLWKLMIPTQKK